MSVLICCGFVASLNIIKQEGTTNCRIFVEALVRSVKNILFISFFLCHPTSLLLFLPSSTAAAPISSYKRTKFYHQVELEYLKSFPYWKYNPVMYMFPICSRDNRYQDFMTWPSIEFCTQAPFPKNSSRVCSWDLLKYIFLPWNAIKTVQNVSWTEKNTAGPVHFPTICQYYCS